jgi:hypothetical protein
LTCRFAKVVARVASLPARYTRDFSLRVARPRQRPALPRVEEFRRDPAPAGYQRGRLGVLPGPRGHRILPVLRRHPPVNANRKPATLASILGLLLIFRGTLDIIITSVDARGINGAWWLGMAAGILEILLGFWASQQYLSVKGALLLVWVGLFALFRGISEIVIAFEVRSRQRG